MLKDASSRHTALAEWGRGHYFTEKDLRSFTEYPYNARIPLDAGSSFFDDVEFVSRPKDGKLVVCDTMTNQNDKTRRHRTLLPEHYTEDVRIFKEDGKDDLLDLIYPSNGNFEGILGSLGIFVSLVYY